MMARFAIMAAALLGGGVVLGRRAIDQKIAEKIAPKIESAKNDAVAELEREIGGFVNRRIIRFAASLAVKAGLVGATYLCFHYGAISPKIFTYAVTGLIFLFVLRDLFLTAPYFPAAWRIARKSNWNPKRALTEFVADTVFARAYANALASMSEGKGRWLIALSTTNEQKLSTEIAEAVADVAASTSFDLVKWRAALAILLGFLMFGAYILFVLLTLGRL